MKILITGGLGFVGANLSDYLLDKGHAVIAVGRAATQERITADRYQYISADTTRPGDWQKALDDVDAVAWWMPCRLINRWSFAVHPVPDFTATGAMTF
jgi:nucleoside-diphosphate-sugar epimerase